MPGNRSFFPSQPRGLRSNTQEPQGLMTNTRTTHTTQQHACTHRMPWQQPCSGPDKELWIQILPFATRQTAFFTNREHISVKVERRKELRFSHFCQILLLAKGRRAETRVPATTCRGLIPASAALIPDQPPPLTINEGEDNISERGPQSAPTFLWLVICSNPVMQKLLALPVATSTDWAKQGPTCSLASARWHGRCAPGTCKVVVYWSGTGKKGKWQRHAAASAAELL